MDLMIGIHDQADDSTLLIKVNENCDNSDINSFTVVFKLYEREKYGM